jgi:hypothetical protein
VELVVARRRSGGWLIGLGAAVLVLAVAVGIAPFLLPNVFTSETLVDWLGGDRLWAAKGPGFVTGELCRRWHPWAVGLLAVAGALAGTGGWLTARKRRPDTGHGTQPGVAPIPAAQSDSGVEGPPAAGAGELAR